MIPRIARHLRRPLLVLLAAFALPAHAQFADLVVNQADSPDPGPAGGVFTYTIRVDNNGPNPAIGVAFADTLPPGSTYVGAGTTQGTCGAPVAGVVTCALGDLAFLANATVTVQVILPVAGVFTNTASATATTPDPNTANNLGVTEDTTAQNASDMTLTVTDAPDPVAAGANYAYTITARNNGPAAAASQTIAFTVPAGACVRSVPTGTGWSCTPGSGYPLCSGAISCTRNTALASGTNAPALTVPAVGNIGGSITAAFQVSSPLPDGNPANNTATATTTVTGGSSDVSITKSASPTTVAVGSNVTYTLTPRHNGGEPPGTLAPNVITVTDTLGAGLSFVSATGSGWTCTLSAPVVTCTRPGPYTGGNYTNMPTIAIVATVTAVGTIANTASIAAPETDPVPANNTVTINVTGGNSADLSVTKTVSQSPVVPGFNFTFTLTARNNGPVAVAAGQTVTVTDTLPAGLNLRAAVTGTGWACSTVPVTPPFPAAGPVTITCSRTLTAPQNPSSNFPTISVPVVATTDGTLSNTACVALSGSGPADSNPANDCGSVNVISTAAAAAADLRVLSKTASPSPVLAGQDLAYTITVQNFGPATATNVVVTDALASLVSAGGFQSATPSQGSCTPSSVTAGPTVNLSCNLGTLASGAAATVVVVVRPSIATSGNRTNTASVTSLDVGDPNRANNTGSVTSAVTAVADVTVSKSAAPNPVQAGTPLTYVVTVRNNGPSTASTVLATDTLPANAAFVALSAVTGTGATCTTPAAGTLGGTVTCTWPSIAAATQQTATFVVRPLTGAPSVQNDVAVTTTTVESSLANNAATITTPVTNAAVDVLVNKVDSVDPVALGQATRYTITVTNAGPSFATGVQLVDTFPAGGAATATFSYQGNLTITPPGAGTCTEPPLGATSGTLACTFPGLANAQSAVVAYDMRAESIASGVSGTSFNTAVVSANEPETLPSNNQTVHATTSRRTADLAVIKVGPASFTPGVPFSWTIGVTNNGPNDSSGAVLTDVLPAGVAFQSASPGCAFAAGTVTCTLGAIANGGNVSIAITVLPSSPYTGASPLVNAATVATVNEVDPVPGNNTGTFPSTPGQGVSDLAVVKTGPASVLPGASIGWQIAITNAGPSAANGATFTDTLPAGVTGVSASCGAPVGGAACGPVNVGTAAVTGTIATLPAGGGVTITIAATAPATGPLLNTVSVDVPPGVTDPVPSNNTSTTTTAVPQPDLAIAKVANGPFSLGQVGASYTITVRNVGGAPSAGTVTMTDTLPAGLTATAIAGTGWACVLGTLTCTRSDALAAGASYPPVTLTVDVALTAPASVTNVANVGGGGDTNPANNQSSVTTPLAPIPDLTVVKTANGAFFAGQRGASYTLVVSNVGTVPSSGTVAVTDTLPPSLTATALSGTGWACVLATLTCTRSDALAAGSSWPQVVLTVDVSPAAPPTIVNLATVSGGGDLNPSNDSTSVSTPTGPAQAPVDVPALSPAGLAALALFLAIAAVRASRFGGRRVPRRGNRG